MLIDSREFKIIIQNLTNRAVDIEIANATVEKRKVDFDLIKENLNNIKAIVGREIVEHEEKLGTGSKKPYNKFK